MRVLLFKDPSEQNLSPGGLTLKGCLVRLEDRQPGDHSRQ